MQQLQVIEHANRRVLTTNQLAEAFETNGKIITRNFQRNKERYEIGKHYYSLSGEDLNQFKASRQNDGTLKFVSVLYLWTELGAWLHAKSLNTDKAWEAYRMLIEEYYAITQMRQGVEDGVNQTPSLSNKEYYHLESRLIALEEQFKNVLTLHSGEQKRLRMAVTERVYQLSRKEKGARPTLFRAIYTELRERYEVESYRDVKQHQLQDALRFVAGWGGESIEKRA
ncbi:ORF6N domain-containing protein [Sporosarcina sp. OR05]|uniref:ORF6N domain-containing protein n=1 Tax=Sporosarcina sp. OR05 TaxID=2969819 RepID=UPI00352A04A7